MSLLIWDYPVPNECEIYIIDGQNRTQIKKYVILGNTDGYDPFFNSISSVSINSIELTFDQNASIEFEDWYPFELCHQNDLQYHNEYCSMRQHQLNSTTYISVTITIQNIQSFVPRAIGILSSVITVHLSMLNLQ